MVVEETVEDERAYRCEECGLHYRDRATAEACEAYCAEHQSCNTELMRYALESAP